MTWAFSANGITEDLTIADQLLADLRAVFGKHEYGTNYTSFSGPNGSASNFHGAGEATSAPEPAAPPEEGQLVQESPPAEVTPEPAGAAQESEPEGQPAT